MSSRVADKVVQTATLESLASVARDLRFELDASTREPALRLADELVRTIDLCRRDIADPDRRVAVAIVGATGSGKSTILNALAGRVVSEPGTLRPTTSRPVVWLEAGADVSLDEPSMLRVFSDDPRLRFVSVIDSPDFDSTVEAHRDTADIVLEHADLCLFVTSARRYADDAAWIMLRKARRRHLPIYFVLNRLPPTGTGQILEHYAKRLRNEGLLLLAERSRMLLVEEQQMPADHVLPAHTVAPLNRFLTGLQVDRDRATVLAKAAWGRSAAVHDLAQWLADAVGEEAQIAARLADAAGAAFDVAALEIHRQVSEAPPVDPGQLADMVMELAEAAVIATKMAWGAVEPGRVLLDRPELVGWDLGSVSDAADKAARLWFESGATDRNSAILSEVLSQEASRLGRVAMETAETRGTAETLRDLASQYTHQVDSVHG